MAKIRPGRTGTIKGSVGNTEFIDSNQGNIVRSKPNHANKPTNPRQRVKQRMKHVSNNFAYLTYEQALAWDKLGKTFTYYDKTHKKLRYNGWNIYNMLNSNRVEVNLPVILDAPKKIYPKYPKSIEAEIIANPDVREYALKTNVNIVIGENGEIALENNKPTEMPVNDIKIFFDTPIPEDTRIMVFATRALNNSRLSINPHWHKKVAVIDHTFKSGSSISKDYTIT